MSSSDLGQFPDWNAFAKREVMLEMSDFLSPALEIESLLQHQEAELKKVREDKERALHEHLMALARQAILVYQLEVKLHTFEASLAQTAQTKVYRPLRIIKDQMLDALYDAGLEITNPLGKPYSQVADWVDVLGWRREEKYTAEIVAEVHEPIVTHRGKLIHRGQVIMEAPADGNEGAYVPEA